MASKRSSRNSAPDDAPGGLDPRIVVPVAGATLAALGTAATVGGRVVLERRRQQEDASRPGLAAVAVVGGLAAAMLALAWRGRDALLRRVDAAVAAVAERWQLRTQGGTDDTTRAPASTAGVEVRGDWDTREAQNAGDGGTSMTTAEVVQGPDADASRSPSSPGE